jgi:hypothetical protein
MHYTDIAEAIAEQQLRTELGATPASTVSSTITTSLNNEGEDSPFIRVARGQYALRRNSREFQGHNTNFLLTADSRLDWFSRMARYIRAGRFRISSSRDPAQCAIHSDL